MHPYVIRIHKIHRVCTRIRLHVYVHAFTQPSPFVQNNFQRSIELTYLPRSQDQAEVEGLSEHEENI